MLKKNWSLQATAIVFIANFWRASAPIIAQKFCRVQLYFSIDAWPAIDFSYSPGEKTARKTPGCQ